MTDKERETPVEGQPETEAPPEGESAPAAVPAKQSKPPAKSSRWLWIILVIFILMLPFGWLLAPEKIRQPYMERMGHWFNTRNQQKAAVRQPAASPIIKPRKTLQAAVAPQVHLPHTASSAEAALLLKAIKALQEDLRQAQQASRASVRALRKQQNIDLKMRLRWIAQPESRLPQLLAYWEDIALLSVLGEREQAQVAGMLKLARQQTSQERRWRSRLVQLAHSLPMPEVEEVNIRSDNKWLAWLAGQFRLSTSPSLERRKILALRNQLLAAGQRLTNGEWPAAADWQSLLDQLRQEFGDDAELALPESFDAVQNDIRTMRQTARDWLEKLADGVAEEMN